MTDHRDIDLLNTARRVLDIHAPDNAGMCSGCQRTFWQLKRAPCSQAEWAQRVMDTYSPSAPVLKMTPEQ